MSKKNWHFKLLIDESSDDVHSMFEELRKENDESVYSLYLNYIVKDIPKALELFEHIKKHMKLKKRNTFPIFFEYLRLGFFGDAFCFYEREIESVFKLDEEHFIRILGHLIEYECSDLLETVMEMMQLNIDEIGGETYSLLSKLGETRICNVSKGVCEEVILDKISDGSGRVRKIVMEKIEKSHMQKYGQTLRKLKNSKFDHKTVIDAANVLYSKGKYGVSAYKRLDKIYDSLVLSGMKPLIVICKTHMTRNKGFFCEYSLKCARYRVIHE